MKLDMDNADLVERVRCAGRYRMTLQHYVGRYRVISEPEFRHSEIAAIGRVRAWVEALRSRTASDPLRRLDFSGLQNCRVHFARETGSMMSLSFRNGAVIGGKFNHVPYVLPHLRGRGYGRLMAFTSDIFGQRGIPSHYSEEGFKARLGAHALHVAIASRAGLTDIPEEVRAQYHWVSGELCPVVPWTAGDQNELISSGRPLARCG